MADAEMVAEFRLFPLANGSDAKDNGAVRMTVGAADEVQGRAIARHPSSVRVRVRYLSRLVLPSHRAGADSPGCVARHVLLIGPGVAVASSSMATRKAADEPLVQMATRVPVSLAQRVRIHCVEREVTMMRFVEDALREKLRRTRRRRD